MGCEATAARTGERCRRDPVPGARFCNVHGGPALPPRPVALSGKQCAAIKKDGEQCKKAPVLGASVCRSHGAAAGQVRAKAARRVAEARAREEIGRLGFGPVDDPVGELELIAGEIVAIKDYLRAQVEALTSIRYRAESEQTRAELSCYMAALRDCTSVMEKLAKLSLEDRRVRLREQQAELLSAAVMDTLRAAGLEGEILERSRQFLGRRLRVIKGELAERTEAAEPVRPGGA